MERGTLKKSGEPLVKPAVLTRFDGCGNNVVVMKHRKDDRWRLKGSFCRNRWCSSCAARRHRQVRWAINRALAKCYADHPEAPPRKGLLTLRTTDDGLAYTVARMQRSFRALTKTDLWARNVTGYVWALECKRQDHSGQWYVHMHLIILTKWLPGEALQRAWYGITGDSWLATCSTIDNRTDRESADSDDVTPERLLKAAGYISKYITKPANLAKMAKVYAVEAVEALASKRLWTCGGLFKEARREIAAADADQWVADDWRPVDNLHVVVARAKSGQAPALKILEFLGLLPKKVKRESGPTTHAPESRNVLPVSPLGPDG